MKSAHVSHALRPFLVVALGLVLSATALRAQIITEWTFESHPVGGTSSHWFTNIAAEVGTGTGGVFHNTSSYGVVSAGGFASAYSLSTSNWSVGDFFQFTLSTVGYSNLQFSYDMTSVNHGPGGSMFFYSTDGVQFRNVGGTNTIPAIGSTWATGDPAYTMSFDLSSITDLNNASVVYFRLMDPYNLAAGGGTVSGMGMELIDNVTVSVVPEPQGLALLGGLMLLGQCMVCRCRSRRVQRG